jgi:hypothetical protein
MMLRIEFFGVNYQRAIDEKDGVVLKRLLKLSMW